MSFNIMSFNVSVCFY